jgi:hypothetical protein
MWDMFRSVDTLGFGTGAALITAALRVLCPGRTGMRVLLTLLPGVTDALFCSGRVLVSPHLADGPAWNGAQHAAEDCQAPGGPARVRRAISEATMQQPPGGGVPDVLPATPECYVS